MRNMLFALTVMFFAGVAFAQPSFNYDYAEARANVLDVKNGENGNSGFEVAFSKSVTDTVFLTGSFNRNDLVGADTDLWRLGANLRTPLSHVVDFYAGAFAQRAVLDYDAVVIDDLSSYGFGGLVGLRWSVLGDRAEVGATFESSRLASNSSWNEVGAVNGRFGLTENLSVVGEVRFEDDANEYLAGLRYQF